MNKRIRAKTIEKQNKKIKKRIRKSIAKTINFHF